MPTLLLKAMKKNQFLVDCFNCFHIELSKTFIASDEIIGADYSRFYVGNLIQKLQLIHDLILNNYSPKRW